MNKLYQRIIWENFPSERTALNESNLNRMDLALDNMDNRVIEMDSTKVNVEVANTLIKNWTMDEATGVITVEKLNGEKIIFDLNTEKIPVDFKLSEDGILTMTTDDGTQFTANIGAMIPILTFEDSDEIAVSVTGTGVNKTYSFSIKAGSVTEDKLQPNFLADIKTDVAKAEASQAAAADSASAASNIATMAESYTHGGTGAREGEETDNAKYYMEQAKAVSAVDIATTEKAGIVKPDGTTITVDPDGTIHGSSSVDLSGYYNNANYDTNKNVLQLMHDDTVLKELKISGGGTKIVPKDTVDPAILNGNAKVTISWGDPGDFIIDGIVLSAWKGTKLVMKESGYPENENDGTLILDNTVRDAYKTSGYVVDGLTNGNTYYFALFPYSTDGVYNYSASNRLLGNPSLVKLDSCTNMQISAAMGSVTVTWDDPDATKTVDGNTATWAKTVLVYKQGSVAPNSPEDGTIAVTETTRNQYASVGYEVTGLTDGKQYTFALFAISTDETSSDAVSATAKLWATLTVNTTEETLFGKTVTATNEVKTVSGTFSGSGSATLQIPWIGLTTVTSTDGTDTADDTVDVTAYMATYSTQITFIPDGETVTPIDDVSILLKCAGIKDKNYTTMEEVLADDEVMMDITIDENSMKYLARSTGFADDVCANETFMTFLGQSLYVDDTVLNSDLWVKTILASPYCENILVDVIPTAIYSKGYNQDFGTFSSNQRSGHAGAWIAFMKRHGYRWGMYSGENVYPDWIALYDKEVTPTNAFMEFKGNFRFKIYGINIECVNSGGPSNASKNYFNDGFRSFELKYTVNNTDFILQEKVEVSDNAILNYGSASNSGFPNHTYAMSNPKECTGFRIDKITPFSTWYDGNEVNTYNSSNIGKITIYGRKL